MAIKISEALGVTTQVLDDLGVFDGFLDIDAKLYVDPHLLQASTTPEMLGAYDNFTKHFAGIISLLEASKSKGDRFYRDAVNRLTFKELAQIGLGYSKAGNPGSGIGPGLAANLAETSSIIIEAGIKDPILFELVGLFEENIGADRISDMTVHIILPNLLNFSQRIAKQLSLPTKQFMFRGQKFLVPSAKGQPLVLIPQEILRDLPIAEDWSDIDIVCSHNEQLRSRVNEIIGDTWKKATQRVPKGALRYVLLRNPEILKDLILQYKKKPITRYDFEEDPAGELIWHDIAKKFTGEFPLLIKPPKAFSEEDILSIIESICYKFKELVEVNGLFKVFYSDKGKLRHERFPQLLFYAVADCYCQANNIDLSREPNAGRGAVDFKFSHGYDIKVTVEIKYSSNPNLVKGYVKQLPIYNLAERAKHSIYLAIRTTETTNLIDQVQNIRSERIKQQKETPEIIVVDGRIHPSASK